VGRTPIEDRMAEELIRHLAGRTRALVFADSRGVVETTYERVVKLVDRSNLFAVAHHHSSVPKNEPEKAERQMRLEDSNGDNPERMVVICSNTLELGIDIGKVERVIQIEPTFSVSALRQRIGRSGRHGDEGAEGIIYVAENAVDAWTHPLERLRLRTIQAVATAQLALESVYETPNLRDLHLLALYHQVLSLLRERGVAKTEDLQAISQAPSWSGRQSPAGHVSVSQQQNRGSSQEKSNGAHLCPDQPFDVAAEVLLPQPGDA
jgi:ATP-dependent helicase Lhr and Lhr-like helicase